MADEDLTFSGWRRDLRGSRRPRARARARA